MCGLRCGGSERWSLALAPRSESAPLAQSNATTHCNKPKRAGSRDDSPRPQRTSAQRVYDLPLVQALVHTSIHSTLDRLLLPASSSSQRAAAALPPSHTTVPSRDSPPLVSREGQPIVSASCWTELCARRFIRSAAPPHRSRDFLCFRSRVLRRTPLPVCADESPQVRAASSW